MSGCASGRLRSEAVSLILKTLIFTVLVPGMATVGVPYVLLSSDLQYSLSVPHPLGGVGAVPVLVGVGIYLWCAADFIFAGQGTPNPADPPKLLVSRGLYNWVRNPMYVGIVLILLGEGLVFDSLTLIVYAATLWLLFHLRVLWYEERNLRAQFGASYVEYCRRVPRWIPYRRRV
jgi:protein-S-isoprenylcysteine O-methyltransferase Ste14